MCTSGEDKLAKHEEIALWLNSKKLEGRFDRFCGEIFSPEAVRP
jgi:hypothetical protein